MSTKKKTHWIVHTGEKFTDGSYMGYYYKTKEEAQQKLDEIRNDFNIAEVDGEYEE